MTFDSTATGPDQTINAAELLEEIGGDQELLLTLIETAQHDLPHYVSVLLAAASRGDYEELRLTAHAMKTTLAHWQAEQARGLALGIEVNCREGRYLQALGSVSALELAVHEVVNALAKLKDKS